MLRRFIAISAFSPKIEWLWAGGGLNQWADLESCIKWVWETLPPYRPLALDYHPQIMVAEDLPEELRLMEQQELVKFNHVWLQSMVGEDNPLREKMALFWHHHIPSSSGRRPDHGRLLIEEYRKYGLGNLKDLLNAVLSSSTMMWHLDLFSSHKNNPNENFAREFMELFTLGEGHYSLKDVKEAARALTGRYFDKKSYPYRALFDPAIFDDGVKTILGKTGHFGGEEVIEIILGQAQTARHIARAVLRFFFSDNPPDQMVESCAEAYYSSGYEMRVLLESMFRHEAFLSPEYNKSKVKTPVELLVGFQRQTGLRTVGMKTAYQFLLKCGQVFFYPPTVAGWPGGEDWLRGERLLHRLFLPGALIAIANRQVPKNSLTYKLSSRAFEPSKRRLRYIADAKWDRGRFYAALNLHGIPVSKWILGETHSEIELEDCLQHPDYQYC